MAYQPTVWKNREVEKPRTFTLQNNQDGTVTLIPAEGKINEPGTPIMAANLNKIEGELVRQDREVTTHLEESKKHFDNQEIHVTQKLLDDVKISLKNHNTFITNADILVTPGDYPVGSEWIGSPFSYIDGKIKGIYRLQLGEKTNMLCKSTDL